MWAHFHGNHPRRSATIWQWSPKSFAIDFFELRPVEASPWTMSFLSMFTFIFRWKNVRFYCAFCHNKALKIFRQDFEVNKNMDDSIFQNFAEVRDPILTSFLMMGCLSKWFSKHIEELNALQMLWNNSKAMYLFAICSHFEWMWLRSSSDRINYESIVCTSL